MLDRFKKSVLYSRYKHSDAYNAVRRWNKAFKRKRELPRYLGSDYECPICFTGLRAFKPIWKSFVAKAKDAGCVHPLTSIETFNMQAMECPACGGLDRYRLYALYFDKLFTTSHRGRRWRMVDFASGPMFRRRMEAFPFIDYRSADLLKNDADDHVDVTDMRIYADGSLDIVLCSHVLEHVADDRKAMREILRVLRPGGFAIVMVPLVHGVEKTHENDPAVDTPMLRYRHYLDEDHVRLYGKRDFVARLAAAGFRVERLGIDHFGPEAFRRAAIAPDSVLYVAHKDAPAA